MEIVFIQIKKIIQANGVKINDEKITDKLKEFEDSYGGSK